ncbi:unnamed protein product [Ostreobium quekettii]|uniref:Uncharacterized protein n=1 Tax=Ostreobium quekettii TaxID=121088 RepID=A0A8S1ITL5_9CHLO|nr:unnamed protein product [Ostreobium quekettii]|eukprot:evm.model.scf_139.7 EVM.evm.TU.scf_139.7   scf_139:79119-83621(+)
MPPRASWRCLPCSLPSPLRRPSPSPFVRIPPTSRGLRAPVLRRAQRCGGRSRGAEEAPGGGPDDRDLIRILAEAARAGRGLGPQELADLVANFGAGDGGEQDGDAEAGKEREAEDFFDLPQAAKDVLSEAGVLDAVPWDGRLAVPPRFGKFLDEEDVDVLERLQEPPPVDEAEAEELRKAQMRAAEKVQRMLEDGPSIMDKVEDAYGAAVDDEEVDEDVVVSDINNLGEEEDEGYGDSPDDDLEGLFDVEAMERGMATLAAGEQLPDVKQYACEPEDAQSFKKCVGG